MAYLLLVIDIIGGIGFIDTVGAIGIINNAWEIWEMRYGSDRNLK